MSRYDEFLENLNRNSMLRHIPSEREKDRIDLVSNDYLGLSRREPEFRQEFFSLYHDAAFSSSASRLLSREQKFHNLLEERLASLYGKHLLLYNSGYHANVGTLSALSAPDTLIIDDELMHASGIDGLMLGKSLRKGNFIRFPHNDISALNAIIEENKHKYKTLIIATESIFSMDGDIAPIKELVKIKKKADNILIYLDEAHAFGVRGERGLGLAEDMNLISDIDILVGTFGKAAASAGAFIATSRDIRDFLLNTSRSFIFSTALPPINIAWTLFMLERIINMKREREYLKELSAEFSVLMSEKLNQPIVSCSQIIPYLCGSADKAIALSSALRDNGFDVLPIRRPTVPPGGERIRFSLNATLSIDELCAIPDIIISHQ